MQALNNPALGDDPEQPPHELAGAKIGFMREGAWPSGHSFRKQRGGAWALRFRSATTPFNIDYLSDVPSRGAPELSERLMYSCSVGSGATYEYQNFVYPLLDLV